MTTGSVERDLIDELCRKHKDEYIRLVEGWPTTESLSGMISLQGVHDPIRFELWFRYRTLSHLAAQYGRNIDGLRRDYP